MANNNSQSKRKAPWTIIMKRELAAYFTSPVAYIVCVLFLAFAGFFFFQTFFISRRAELRGFFSLLPILFAVFIPALTMRVFSEEKRSGSIETLLTLPVTPVDVVAGKYLASLVSAAVLLVPTLSYVVTCAIFGKPDFGPIIGGYLGAVLLAATYTSIGVFASAITKNQIISFFVALPICLALSMISFFSVLLPAPVVSVITFFSAADHFDSISRGIIDSRDVLYFLSVTALFIVLTVRAIRGERRS